MRAKPHLVGVVFLSLFFSATAFGAEVSATAYNATVRQTGHTNGPTASGAPPIPGISVAIQRQLKNEYPLWSVVAFDYATVKQQPKRCGIEYVKHAYLPRQFAIVLDYKAMGAKGEIDFLMPSHATIRLPGGQKMNPADAFGRCQGITMHKVMVLRDHDLTTMPKTETELLLVVRHYLTKDQISQNFIRRPSWASPFCMLANTLVSANVYAWTRKPSMRLCRTRSDGKSSCAWARMRKR